MTRQDFLKCMALAGQPGPAVAVPGLAPLPKSVRWLGGTCRVKDRVSERVEDPGVGGSSPEAFRVRVEAGAIRISGRTAAGVRAGRQALAQVMADGEAPCCEIASWPDVAWRCAHICYHLVTEKLAYHTPGFPAVLAHIDELAELQYNAILLELEALFPYRRHKLASCGIRFTPAQIAAIGARCKEHGMELVPLVQCLGHAYNVLVNDEYAAFREVPGSFQQFCPTHPDLPKLYMEFVEEYLESFPGVRQWHMGGDESYQLGQCPRCRAKAKQHGVSRVYVDYVGEVARRLRARGLAPMIWSDMLEHHPEAVPQLPRDLKLVYWNYHLPTWGRPYAVEQFRKQGFQVVAAPAVRYGGFSEMSVYYPTALEGIETLIPRAHRDGVTEVIVTNWIKGSPYELSHYGFAYGAELCWNAAGKPADFRERYARAAFGCRDASLCDVYDLLSNKTIPYAEPVLAHQPFNTNRYDQSGFRFAEKWEQYAAAERRPGDSPALFVGFLRQFYKNQKCWEPEVLEQLQNALERAVKAARKVEELVPRCPRGKRQLELLGLCAASIQAKTRLALALHEGKRVLAGEDRAAMEGWLERWPAVSREWDEARRAHKAGLGKSGFAPCVEVLNDQIFERAEHDFFVEMRARMLRKLG